MFRSVEGVFKEGRVELLDPVDSIKDNTPVIVTFLPASMYVDLRSRGISKAQAASLRARLSPIADDWNDASMDGYDHYDR